MVGKSHKTIGRIHGQAMLPIDSVIFLSTQLICSAGIQSTGKGSGNLEAALLGKIHGLVDVALFAGQLHALNVLQHLTIFEALILGKVLFRTVFTWRRYHL